MDKKLLAVIVGVIILVVAGFYILKAQPPQKLEAVTAVMPFVANSEWLGFYAADLQGYYQEEGLKVNLEYTDQGSFYAVKQVASGNAPFGYAGGDSVVVARAQGLPVVAVYQEGQENEFGLTFKKGKINKPQDLVGKTIAIPGPGSSPDIAARAILKNSGVDLKSVSFVPVGAGLVPALLQGKADAIAGYIIHELILTSQGVNYGVWYAKDFNANFAGLSIITSAALIKQNPDLVKRFVRATNKGFIYAMENPAAMVDGYIAKFNPQAQKDRQLELDYWTRLTKEVYRPEKYTPGSFNDAKWQLTQDTLFNLGIITAKTDITKAYTKAFLP